MNAVRKAVAAGRLVRSVVKVDGKPKIGDADLADVEWVANTTRKNRNVNNVRAGAGRASPSPSPSPSPSRRGGAPGGASSMSRPMASSVASSSSDASSMAPSRSPGHLAPSPTPLADLYESRDARGRRDDNEPLLNDDGVISLYEAKRLKEIQLWRQAKVKADSDGLELEKKRGNLVAATDIRATVVDKFSIVRTRLLGIPSRCAQRIGGLSAEDVILIEDLIREALSEIADGYDG